MFVVVNTYNIIRIYVVIGEIIVPGSSQQWRGECCCSVLYVWG